MVMVPKLVKDINLVNGWRPIVLPNTVGELSDRLIADQLQSHKHLFHEGQYSSRKGRSAMTLARMSGHQVSHLGRDIVSAFNHARRDGILANLDGLRGYVAQFLQPGGFTVWWGQIRVGKSGTQEDTPQGSPVSPILFRIYFANTLRNGTHTPHTTCAGRARPSIERPSPPICRRPPPLVISYTPHQKPHNTHTRVVERILDQEWCIHHYQYLPLSCADYNLHNSAPLIPGHYSDTISLSINDCKYVEPLPDRSPANLLYPTASCVQPAGGNHFHRTSTWSDLHNQSTYRQADLTTG